MPKVIFVSGPYRAATEWGVEENIRSAEAAAITLWKKNWVVICPHLNTRRFGGMLPDQVWLNGDLEILRRCDAICLLPGWAGSHGSATEQDTAMMYNLEIYFGVESVPVLGTRNEKRT